MTPASDTVWGELLHCLTATRESKPRTSGLTCVLDKHLGLEGTAELIATAGHLVDVVKLTSLTAAFYPEDLLRRKIAMLRDARISVCPGGTCSEVMIWQKVYPDYLQRARDLGFNGIEISDGTINMPDALRREVIGRAADMGFFVYSEVGRKEWSEQTGLSDLVADLERDLACGAEKVIVEAMEVGRSVGIMDAQGRPDEEGLKALVKAAGGLARIIFEAPLRNQQELFIDRLGSEVNLGNIPPHEVLVVEATRMGTTGIPFMTAYAASPDGPDGHAGNSATKGRTGPWT
ncbi:MAG: phosphosulfolactate synthase [Desulfovibrio sp.]|jgi:phosphosulfolactate synthase|nr:phosphosulfolactate synthase [Desulfovibrio sp.]